MSERSPCAPLPTCDVHRISKGRKSIPSALYMWAHGLPPRDQQVSPVHPMEWSNPFISCSSDKGPHCQARLEHHTRTHRDEQAPAPDRVKSSRESIRERWKEIRTQPAPPLLLTAACAELGRMEKSQVILEVSSIKRPKSLSRSQGHRAGEKKKDKTPVRPVSVSCAARIVNCTLAVNGCNRNCNGQHKRNAKFAQPNKGITKFYLLDPGP